MRLLDYIKKPITDYVKNLGTVHYQSDQKPPETFKYNTNDIPEFVPQEYRQTIVNNANEFDIDPRNVSAIIHVENTPWDPKLKNPTPGSSAIGLGQHTDAYYKDINPIFKQRFNRDYSKIDPKDAIAATFIGLKQLKDRLGSEEDAIKAYHVGYEGLKNPSKEYDSHKKQADEYFKKVISNLDPRNMVK